MESQPKAEESKSLPLDEILEVLEEYRKDCSDHWENKYLLEVESAIRQPNYRGSGHLEPEHLERIHDQTLLQEHRELFETATKRTSDRLGIDVSLVGSFYSTIREFKHKKDYSDWARATLPQERVRQNELDLPSVACPDGVPGNDFLNSIVILCGMTGESLRLVIPLYGYNETVLVGPEVSLAEIRAKISELPD